MIKWHVKYNIGTSDQICQQDVQVISKETNRKYADIPWTVWMYRLTASFLVVNTPKSSNSYAWVYQREETREMRCVCKKKTNAQQTISGLTLTNYRVWTLQYCGDIYLTEKERGLWVDEVSIHGNDPDINDEIEKTAPVLLFPPPKQNKQNMCALVFFKCVVASRALTRSHEPQPKSLRV